jgi:Mn-dependent DtxR family transcriptional regulator
LILSEKALTSSEIAEGLKFTIKAVNMALFRLKKKGLVNPVSRGSYSYTAGPLLTTLLDSFFKVERERK